MKPLAKIFSAHLAIASIMCAASSRGANIYYTGPSSLNNSSCRERDIDLPVSCKDIAGSLEDILLSQGPTNNNTDVVNSLVHAQVESLNEACATRNIKLVYELITLGGKLDRFYTFIYDEKKNVYFDAASYSNLNRQCQNHLLRFANFDEILSRFQSLSHMILNLFSAFEKLMPILYPNSDQASVDWYNTMLSGSLYADPKTLNQVPEQLKTIFDVLFARLETGQVKKIFETMKFPRKVDSELTIGSKTVRLMTNQNSFALSVETYEAILAGLFSTDDNIEQQDVGGRRTPLITAAMLNNTNLALALLRQNANVHTSDTRLGSAIIYASINSNVCLLEALIGRGANVNLRGNGYVTALLIAVRNNDRQTIEFLLAHNADPNLGDVEGMVPIHLASKYGRNSVVELLLEHGANVNASTHRHKTALHYAIEAGSSKTVCLLIDWEANLELLIFKEQPNNIKPEIISIFLQPEIYCRLYPYTRKLFELEEISLAILDRQ